MKSSAPAANSAAMSPGMTFSRTATKYGVPGPLRRPDLAKQLDRRAAHADVQDDLRSLAGHRRQRTLAIGDRLDLCFAVCSARENDSRSILFSSMTSTRMTGLPPQAASVSFFAVAMSSSGLNGFMIQPLAPSERACWTSSG